MTSKERMATALKLGIPDRVPTFELEFQLSEELMGKPFLTEHELEGLSASEVNRKIAENAQFMIQVYDRLEHDAICIQYLNEEHTIQTIRRLHEYSGDRFMLLAHGDGTFAIPDGDGMLDFAYRIADDPESVHEQAEQMVRHAMEHDLRLLDAGLDGFILCSDYCFNKGPFLSPRMFAEFVTPYLARLIETIRDHGGYAIKHTDGNIMPILDQLVSTRPHALHSIDPMAGVDIREV